MLPFPHKDLILFLPFNLHLSSCGLDPGEGSCYRHFSESHTERGDIRCGRSAALYPLEPRESGRFSWNRAPRSPAPAPPAGWLLCKEVPVWCPVDATGKREINREGWRPNEHSERTSLALCVPAREVTGNPRLPKAKHICLCTHVYVCTHGCIFAHVCVHTA